MIEPITFASPVEVREAIYKARLARAYPIPETVQDAIDTAIIAGDLQALIAVARAIWDEGADIDEELLAVAAGMFGLVDQYSFDLIGKDGTALRMQQALMRDMGVPGNWPDADTDPPRGVAPFVAGLVGRLLAGEAV